MASSDYVLQEVKGIKKSFDNASKLSIMQFADSRIFDIQDTTEWSEIFTSTEGFGGTKELAENETPPVNRLQDGYSVTLTTKRYGNAIEVTETDMEKMGDSTVMVETFLNRQRDQVVRDVKHKFITELHLTLNEAFDSTSDYLAPDSAELCGTHTWKSGTTFSNAATAALDSDAIDTLLEYAGAFTAADGKEMPQNFDTIVVKKGSAAARMAKKLFAEGISPTAISDINIYEGEFTIIETPYITSTNKTYWFALALGEMGSPIYAGIKRFPSMKAPKAQNNEAVRSNVTGFWKIGIQNMPFNFYGSDGTV